MNKNKKKPLLKNPRKNTTMTVHNPTNSKQHIDNIKLPVDEKVVELNEEWNNFIKRVGEVGNLVRDMASGDKERSEAAKKMADQYLEGKVIVDEDVKMTVKSDRTVVNQKAFDDLGKTKDPEKMDPEVWMAEMSKDAERRALNRKIRREKANTFKTQAIKAFRRGEYEKALSCYDRAIEQIKDDAMMLCDRALTNIKLGNFEKVFDDCYWALRLNENSYKARLYRAKAYKELEETEKYEESKKELDEMFPQHSDLTKYFLNKREGYYDGDDNEVVEIKF